MMLPRREAAVDGGRLGDQHPPPSAAGSSTHSSHSSRTHSSRTHGAQIPATHGSPTVKAPRRRREAPPARPAPDAPDDDAGVQARTRILDAAATLFATHGFDGTPTARIARTAGVPKGLLFYYFATKPAILTALLTERLGIPEFAELDTSSLAAPGDPVRALLNVGDWILRNHEASDVLREIIWHESHTRPEVGAVLTRYRRGLHDTIEQVLAASLSGPVDERALRAAASAWGATMTARPLPGHGAADLHGEESLHAIAELLCEGLHAPTASQR